MRREAIRKKAKENKQWEREELATRPKGVPICNETIKKAEELTAFEASLQVAHNEKIIEAILEEKIKEEQNNKVVS